MFRMRELARREDPECRADLHPASGAGASEHGIDRIVADAVKRIEVGVDGADIDRILDGRRQPDIGRRRPNDQPAGDGKHLIGEERGLVPGSPAARKVPVTGLR